MQKTKLSFPEAEAALVRERYAAARVILEYGSGDSTVLAAEMPGKYVMSVESDRDWAISLQSWLHDARLPSPAIVWHVDIGPTGRWGRPLDDSAWQRFHRYPLQIWSEPFFRHPDVILIDGRFRPACLVAACLRIEQPATVLFDDYTDRPSYQAVVERLMKPERTVGRIAEFQIVPQAWPNWAHDLLQDLCTQASYAADHVDYGASGTDAR